MRRIIILLAALAACFAFMGGRAAIAHAGPPPPSAFVCTGGYAKPVIGVNTGDGTSWLHVYDSSGLSCSGGTGTGWVLRLTPEYKSSTGAWHFAENSTGGDYFLNLPNGNFDCKQPPDDHFGSGATRWPEAYWGDGISCSIFSTPYSNDESTGADDVYDASGSDLDAPLNYMCQPDGLKDWRIKYYFQDNGNLTGNTQINYSAETPC